MIFSFSSRPCRSQGCTLCFNFCFNYDDFNNFNEWIFSIFICLEPICSDWVFDNLKFVLLDTVIIHVVLVLLFFLLLPSFLELSFWVVFLLLLSLVILNDNLQFYSLSNRINCQLLDYTIKYFNYFNLYQLQKKLSFKVSIKKFKNQNWFNLYKI